MVKSVVLWSSVAVAEMWAVATGKDVMPGPGEGFVCKTWWRFGFTLLRASSGSELLIYSPCIRSGGAQIPNPGVFLLGVSTTL